jgi:CheY-like chemotaxis protein/two-component sensor histidine kinase
MSHEIRTPMNGIIGMGKLLQRSSPREDQLEYIDAINASSEQLLLLINDILDISKIEAGKLQLEPHDFELDTLISEVTRLFWHRAREKGLRLEHTISPETPIRLHADATRLRQVLMNLLSNAIKFTHEGSVKIAASGHMLEPERAQITLSVTDTGVGIPPERSQHIFEEFTQLDMGASRRYEGTGLGLAICKRLVQAMGGAIRLSSSNQEGSTFTVQLTLPLSTGTSGEAEQTTTHQVRAAMPPLNILLAEDNQINSRVARTLLEQKGHRVTIAINGADALAMHEQGDFDLILMDLHMPVMDGLEATRRIRAMDDVTKSRIPIIALTANIMQEERDRCLSLGMDNFLAKPFTPEKLEDLIIQTLSAIAAKGSLDSESAHD